MPAPAIGISLVLPFLVHTKITTDGVDANYEPLAPLQQRAWFEPPAGRLHLAVGGSEPFVEAAYRRRASHAGSDDFILRSLEVRAGYSYRFRMTEQVNGGPSAWLGYEGAKGSHDDLEAASIAALVGLGAGIAYEPAPSLRLGVEASLSIGYGQAEGSFRPVVDPLASIETNDPYAFVSKGAGARVVVGWVLP